MKNEGVKAKLQPFSIKSCRIRELRKWYSKINLKYPNMICWSFSSIEEWHECSDLKTYTKLQATQIKINFHPHTLRGRDQEWKTKGPRRSLIKEQDGRLYLASENVRWQCNNLWEKYKVNFRHKRLSLLLREVHWKSSHNTYSAI